MTVEAHELAMEIWDEQGDQMGISAKLVSRQVGLDVTLSLG